MAEASSTNSQPDSLPAWKRSRLERGFEHAKKIMGQDEYDFGYATTLLEQCVLGDPANIGYMQAFLENLHRKYKNNRKGQSLAMVSGLVHRAKMNRAIGRADWDPAIKCSLELLKLNPWDTGALSAMAVVNDKLGNADCQRHWLKAALAAKPNDPEMNRQAAIAMAKIYQFDQAIACWHRVEKARPNDEEAQREISNLTLQKTRMQGGISTEADAGPSAPTQATSTGAADILSVEEKLRREIAKDPKNVKTYLAFAHYLIAEERYEEAARVLTKAVKIAPTDVEIHERLEDSLQQYWRKRVVDAEKQMKATPTEETQQEYRRMRKKFRLQELEIYKARAERYPTNLIIKFHLGARYKAVGDFSEAIKHFQDARNEPRHKGQCLFNLAECFRQIKQYRMAMEHYKAAIEEIPDRQLKDKKEALYRAAKLAIDLHDIKLATQYVTALAKLDFSYKDVSALLAKLEELIKESPPEAEGPDEAMPQGPPTDTPPPGPEDEVV